MKSIWQEGVKLPSFPSGEGELKTDVLIIGGGLAGLLLAYELESEGVDYLLVESDKIASKITKDTTAKITSQHGLIYNSLISRFGIERSEMYLRANERAVEKYRKIAEEIKCDFEDKDAVTYSKNDRAILEKELIALEKLGYGAEFAEKLPLPFDVAGGIVFKNQAQFHPLKFIAGISKNLRILEDTKVEEFGKNSVRTSRGKITAGKVVVATHFPILNKHGMYFIKMYQHRSYVLALEGAGEIDGMYVDEDEKGLSFRNYGKYLLLGGGSHRTGERGGSYPELEEFSRKYYPDAKIKYRFATQDCMTLDSVPYIGKYSKNTDNLYVITGFNKWGMTSSMVAADIISSMLLGRDNDCAEVFSPDRSVITPTLFKNIAKTTISLITPTTPRCPHLGCALKYNREEHSWDCPCHGSRFGEDMTLIDNPATDNAKRKGSRI